MDDGYYDAHPPMHATVTVSASDSSGDSTETGTDTITVTITVVPVDEKPTISRGNDNRTR